MKGENPLVHNHTIKKRRKEEKMKTLALDINSVRDGRVKSKRVYKRDLVKETLRLDLWSTFGNAILLLPMHHRIPSFDEINLIKTNY